MYVAYVLRSLKDGELYYGYTADLKNRLKYHNDGNVQATKHRRPLKLIYCEGYLHQQDATSREKFFKSKWGRNFLNRVLKNYWNTDP